MADSWQCRGCGTTNLPLEFQCLGCGTAVSARIVLTSMSTGIVLDTSQPLKVGRVLLRTLDQDDAKYIAEPQFELVRDGTDGSWRIVPAPGTPNKTCYGGVPLDSKGQALAAEGIIEIGPGKMKLRVSFENL